MHKYTHFFHNPQSKCAVVLTSAARGPEEAPTQSATGSVSDSPGGTVVFPADDVIAKKENESACPTPLEETHQGNDIEEEIEFCATIKEDAGSMECDFGHSNTIVDESNTSVDLSDTNVDQNSKNASESDNSFEEIIDDIFNEFKEEISEKLKCARISVLESMLLKSSCQDVETKERIAQTFSNLQVVIELVLFNKLSSLKNRMSNKLKGSYSHHKPKVIIILPESDGRQKVGVKSKEHAVASTDESVTSIEGTRGETQHRQTDSQDDLDDSQCRNSADMYNHDGDDMDDPMDVDISPGKCSGKGRAGKSGHPSSRMKGYG